MDVICSMWVPHIKYKPLLFFVADRGLIEYQRLNNENLVNMIDSSLTLLMNLTVSICRCSTVSSISLLFSKEVEGHLRPQEVKLYFKKDNQTCQLLQVCFFFTIKCGKFNCTNFPGKIRFLGFAVQNLRLGKIPIEICPVYPFCENFMLIPSCAELIRSH